ncbi:hypothetical protein Kpol_1028p7 [Vanderwaltozyma polyspora DSM 70294]|uniref:Uncharacterized protein n=1 Tax=Vanderwaltozyma polyspora (strain ATCC 22028 / DSM 70294 / BCRC 21397 / CBS 2163 / NBRC 10782 / NRRL Y-8283 / UCD 57-17) TaxID=436907 RepID=A7TFX8_VANPO|nr:uncharacterized protein Kpol_1028p7 [Vanderwaltozyma polyspora DSM 70294]EDO18735.1 hypothetical protein Kpol_1028p7 [Vanderwaltozyma polyspora DSM 70294]
MRARQSKKATKASEKSVTTTSSKKKSVDQKKSDDGKNKVIAKKSKAKETSDDVKMPLWRSVATHLIISLYLLYLITKKEEGVEYAFGPEVQYILVAIFMLAVNIFLYLRSFGPNALRNAKFASLGFIAISATAVLSCKVVEADFTPLQFVFASILNHLGCSKEFLDSHFFVGVPDDAMKYI